MSLPPATRCRRAGVALHLSSLPGPHGSGDMGPDAQRWLQWLASAGQKVWQLLPVNPIGPGDSPYQSPSAFAGNPWLVALQPLVDAAWLPAAEACAPQRLRGPAAAFRPWRWQQLCAAAGHFFEALNADAPDRLAYQDWCSSQAHWLPTWTLYAAVKDSQGGLPWWQWPLALAGRDPAALQAAAVQHAAAMRQHAFVQWCFDWQMAELREAARPLGVQIMGDLPIFVAHDSADVWARPDLFWLDEQQQPSVVAGVPPDGYSPDGQRWGNPLYRWDRMQAEGFGWWVARLRRALQWADEVRIDHFRGFAGYWEIPASAPTARAGRWVTAPGPALFKVLQGALADPATGELPLVAEDLGLITPDVVSLRESAGLPGMRIVYEGFFGDASHPFLPHHHVPHMLAYTSTHDSDTVRGWWEGASDAQRRFAATYCSASGAEDFASAVLACTYRSVADTVLAPLQDLLGLGSEYRMNRPGTAQGNWGWRFEWGMLPQSLAPQLSALTRVTGR